MEFDYFKDEPLEVEFPCEAKYCQHVRAETTDALIEAVRDNGATPFGPEDYPNFEPEDFLGRLWNRGFKVVPLDE